MGSVKNKLAKLQATLVQNYDLPTESLTGVKCRATSVAKKLGNLEKHNESLMTHLNTKLSGNNNSFIASKEQKQKR